jgi:hypothetical protein
MGKPDEPLHDLEWLSGYLGGIPERTIYNWRQRNEGPPAYRWANTCATVAVTSKPGLIAAATRPATGDHKQHRPQANGIGAESDGVSVEASLPPTTDIESACAVYVVLVITPTSNYRRTSQRPHSDRSVSSP